MLQDTDTLWCPRGPPQGLGLGNGLGQGHSAVSTHLFWVRGYCLGGVLGCLQPGEGATAPFAVL